MRYILRADASPSIGAGHVMRSSVIAEELISQGKKVVFVGEITDLSWVKRRIYNLGFSQILSDTNDLIPDPNHDVLILDSYTVALHDRFIRKTNWKAIVAICDEFSPLYKSDLVIQLGFLEEAKGHFSIKTLSGPRYIPIRQTIKKNLIVKNSDVLRILVVGGGANTFDFSIAIASVLENIPITFEATIFADLQGSKCFDSRFIFTPIGEIYDESSQTADLAFTTAGTSSFELIAQGVPIGIGLAVKNQEQYYTQLSKLDLAAPIGEFVNGEWDLDTKAIIELVNSKELRMKLIAKSAGLIDFGGGRRIVEEILKL